MTTTYSPSFPSILLTQQKESETKSLSTSINWLLYGDPATGKTHAAFTGRQPIYCQSFDPGGSEMPHILKMVAEGRAIINRDCEVEDARKPTALQAFQNNFAQLEKSGAFNHIGTYVIDSLTFLSDAIMNEILRLEGRAGTHPQIKDYARVKSILKNILNACCALPCDFVLTGHITNEKDEINAMMVTSLAVVGKNHIIIPRYFDEFYVTEVVTNDKKVDYRFLTRPASRYRARTRIGSGIFADYETPDLMYLRRKAGKNIDHLPPIKKESTPTPATNQPTK